MMHFFARLYFEVLQDVRTRDGKEPEHRMCVPEKPQNITARNILWLWRRIVIYILNIVPIIAIASETAISIPDISKFDQQVSNLNTIPNSTSSNQNNFNTRSQYSSGVNNNHYYAPPTTSYTPTYNYAPLPTPSAPTTPAAPKPSQSNSTDNNTTQNNITNECNGGICFGSPNSNNQQQNSSHQGILFG